MANVSIDNLASEIMKGLQEYKDLATADMKTAVRRPMPEQGNFR